MKTYWIHEGEAVKVGDIVDGFKVTEVYSTAVLGRQVDSPDSPTCDLRRVNWFHEFSGPATSLTRITIPEAVPFDAVTGRRLREGDTTASGWVITHCGGSYVKARRPDGRYRVLSASPLSVRAADALIEVRENPTPAQYINGLPRIVDCTCAEGRTDYFVTGMRGRRLPAESSVWTGRVYRLRDEFACDVHGVLRLRSRLPAGWVTLPDGAVCPPSRAALLTAGASAGTYARVEDCLPVDGGWMLRSEMVRTYDHYGYERYLSRVPDDYRALADGTPCHPSACCECHHDGSLFLSGTGVRFGRNTYSRENWDRIGGYCETCGSTFLRDGFADCPNCREHARSRIRNYSNRAANHLISEKDVPIKFGIELEVGCDKGVDRSTCAGLMSDAFEFAGCDPLSYCVYKEDGSLCDCNGFEIVTRPDCPSVHKRVFGGALRDVRLRGKMSSFDNGNCGMHIHVSRAPLNDLWVGRLLVLVNGSSMQPLLHKIAGRSGNRYTNYDSSKKLTSVRRGSDRYEALNVTSDNTIEFRIFRGTLNPVSFVKNIEFVEAALEFTRTATRSLRDAGDVTSFVSFVSKERKSYPTLHQFITSRGL